MRRDLDQPRKSEGRDPTRATPEPWFVGGGQKLMIGVLVTCAVLVALRIAAFIWLAETAWSWWTAPSPVRAPVREQVFRAPPAPPPVLAVDPAKANATVKGNPGQFFGPDAYPTEALRAEQQGRTVADLLVDATGTPVGCTIQTSSGSRSLDVATCSIAIGRIRFEPARDGRGAAKASHYRLPVRWVLPPG